MQMVAKKKTETIKKEKEVKKKPEPQKINLDHDFSFNLLTEPWLPVVSLNGEKKFLSLNDFLKQAQDLERFDFPLPGLETAVLRFLVAVIHIVGAPNDKSDWEDWYKHGKFEDSFITELQKYKDKLDLFSKTEPFLQEIEFTENKIKTSSEFKIIDFFPSGSNSNHFGNSIFKSHTEIILSPAAAVPILLFHQMIPRASKAGPYEQYLNGVIGQTIPYYLLLKGKTIFQTILLNVLDEKYIKDNLRNKIAPTLKHWHRAFIPELSSNEISIPHGLLWKSRSILFLPHKEENSICSILGINTNITISKFCYAPQRSILKNKDISPWEDPFNSIVNSVETKKNGNQEISIKKLAPHGKSLPSWKDFTALIMVGSKQKDNVETKSYPPLILQRFISYRVNSIYVSLSLLSITTKDGQDKIYQLEESLFRFKPDFVSDEEVSSKIKFIVQDTKKFEGKICFSLILAFKLEKKVKTKQGKKIREATLSLFQSA
jgi:CRISPR type I-E-associated protein CasA/Cse1